MRAEGKNVFFNVVGLAFRHPNGKSHHGHQAVQSCPRHRHFGFRKDAAILQQNNNLRIGKDRDLEIRGDSTSGGSTKPFTGQEAAGRSEFLLSSPHPPPGYLIRGRSARNRKGILTERTLNRLQSKVAEEKTGTERRGHIVEICPRNAKGNSSKPGVLFTAAHQNVQSSQGANDSGISQRGIEERSKKVSTAQTLSISSIRDHRSTSKLEASPTSKRKARIGITLQEVRRLRRVISCELKEQLNLCAKIVKPRSGCSAYRCLRQVRQTLRFCEKGIQPPCVRISSVRDRLSLTKSSENDRKLPRALIKESSYCSDLWSIKRLRRKRRKPSSNDTFTLNKSTLKTKDTESAQLVPPFSADSIACSALSKQSNSEVTSPKTTGVSSPQSDPVLDSGSHILPHIKSKWQPQTTKFGKPATHTMSSHLRVVTTPTADTPGTLIELFFGDRRYLVGQVHEGTQRALLENGVKLGRVSDIFVTGRTEWATTGGLMGCLLSIADVNKSSMSSLKADLREKIRDAQRKIREHENNTGTAKQARSSAKTVDQLSKQTRELQKKLDNLEKPHIGIHGGPNLAYLVASSRRFILRKSIHVDILEYGSQPSSPSSSARAPDWHDDRVQVWALPTSPSLSSSTHKGRKRSFTEYAFQPSAKDHSCLSEETRKTSVKIVDHIFNSKWTKSTLEEVSLAEVDPGTNIYLRVGGSSEPKLVTREEAISGQKEPNPRVWISKPWPAATAEMPQPQPSDKALSYIFKTYPQRGKFIASKARDLEVKAGADFGRLCSGESVVSKSGATITPEMVMETSQPGRGFAIIDLPSIEHVAAFVKRYEWTDLFRENVDAFLWILGPGLVHDERIDRMMRERRSAQHLLSCPEISPNRLAMKQAASYAIRLNQLDPCRFPIPLHHNVAEEAGELPYSGSHAAPYEPLQQGSIFHLKPQHGLDNTDVPPKVDTRHVLSTVPETALMLARNVKTILSSSAPSDNHLPSGDAEISFLGTGSAAPSLHRNVSATLLRVPGSGSYLFDCGEGTLGQLRRLYPPDQLSEIFRDLRFIWISHMHADHHLGITSVIQAWYKEVHGGQAHQEQTNILDKQQHIPLCIVGTAAMAYWLKEWSYAENFGFDQLYLVQVNPRAIEKGGKPRLGFYHFGIKPTNSKKERSSPANVSQIEQRWITVDTFNQFGLANLEICGVSHCYAAYAVAVTFPDGFKFSYSGDCRPSARFAEIGSGSTVLVHEATFDDEMQADAKSKKHSTTSEAVAVGLAMKAKRIMLTHFSQRYQKLPVFRKHALLDHVPTEDGTEEQNDATEMVDDGPGADDDGIDDTIHVSNLTDAAIEGQASAVMESSDEALKIQPNAHDACTPLEQKNSQSVVAVDEVHLEKDVKYHEEYDNKVQEQSQQRQDPESHPFIGQWTGIEPSATISPMVNDKSTSSPDGSLIAHQKIDSSPMEVGTPQSPVSDTPHDIKVGVAFDYMRVKVKDIEHLHHFHPAIEALFAAQENCEKALSNEEINRGKRKSREHLVAEKAVATIAQAEFGTGELQDVANEDIAPTPAYPALAHSSNIQESLENTELETKSSALHANATGR